MTTTLASHSERNYVVRLKRPHAQQAAFIDCPAKRIIIRAGRRGGKTVGMAIRAVRQFLAGRRVLYAAPTQEQVATFWWEVSQALAEPVQAGMMLKNESLHVIELPSTKQRIRAKTAWNADTLRGDYADELILDEWQLMDEAAWELVGAPMLLDNDGAAVFIYTPPSLHSRSVSKARDPRHAAKMYQRAVEDRTGRWAAFHFSSHANPHISAQALAGITQDMTSLAVRQEIMAEDVEEIVGAMWTRALLERTRVSQAPEMARVVVGVDPPGGATECGIVVAGLGRDHQCYVLSDRSLRGSPDKWAGAVIDAYLDHHADRVLGEANYGGDMVEATIRQAARSRDVSIAYRTVQATRGKAVRAEPIAAMFEQGRAHIVGEMPGLEEEMVSYVPGQTTDSPNRLDAMVWALTELAGGVTGNLVSFA